VLFVKGLKHNLLSFSQVYDQGCEVVFTSKYYIIKSMNLGQLVAKGIRTEKKYLCVKRIKRRMSLKKV
jgi:hypothetical protein